MGSSGAFRMTRDYKKSNRRSLELARMREFGMGALVGIVLASGVTIFYMGGRKDAANDKAEAPRPDPRRAAPADPEAAPAAGTGEKYDFYEMLPNFEVVVPEKDKEVKRDPPATSPASLMPTARLRVPPKVPRSTIPSSVQRTARSSFTPKIGSIALISEMPAILSSALTEFAMLQFFLFGESAPKSIAWPRRHSNT